MLADSSRHKAQTWSVPKLAGPWPSPHTVYNAVCQRYVLDWLSLLSRVFGAVWLLFVSLLFCCVFLWGSGVTKMHAVAWFDPTTVQRGPNSPFWISGRCFLANGSLSLECNMPSTSKCIPSSVLEKNESQAWVSTPNASRCLAADQNIYFWLD